MMMKKVATIIASAIIAGCAHSPAKIKLTATPPSTVAPGCHDDYCVIALEAIKALAACKAPAK